MMKSEEEMGMKQICMIESPRSFFGLGADIWTPS